MSKKQSHYIQIDLIILLVFLIAVSLLAIYSAQELGQYPGQNFVLKQTMYFAIGIAAMIAIQFIDLDQLYKVSLYFYIFNVLATIVLFFSPTSIARPVNGAKSWFNGSMFPVTIQPTEFLKIALILYLAAIIVKHREKFASSVKNDLWLIVKIAIATAIPVPFVLEQPDLGTTLVILFIAGILVILSGIDWKILMLLLVSGLAATILAVFVVVNFPTFASDVLGIKPHQMGRVLTWFSPDEQLSDDRFHIERSLQTIGSGQLTGKGVGNPEVALPEAHTDFIFSIVGETFGFVGAALVIFAFFLLHYKLVTLGMKSYSHSPFGSYICYGFMSLVLIHTFQNIGMTIGIMPITGIPLLFISFGGSTVLSTLIGYGIIYRIAVENSKQNEYIFK